MPPSSRTCCVWAGWRPRGSHRQRSGSCASWSVTGTSSSTISEPVENYLGVTRWAPRPGNEAETRGLATELERLTQPAAIVVQEYGATVELKPAGTMQYHEANPVLLWSTLFERPLLTADLIVGSCNRALGMLDAEIEDAEAHEGTAAGRIESTLDGPRGIWRALRGDVRRHQGVAWTGFAAGILATVIAAGIVHWLGWA